MNKNKLILITVFLIILLIGFFYLFQAQASKPQYYRAIVVSLKQLAENNLTLEKINIEAIYPAKEEKESKFSNCYEAKILSQNNKVLYSTKIPKQYLYSRFTYPGYEQQGLITKLNSQIELYLPLYTNAQKLVIENENENTMMSINLSYLQNEEVSTLENLCGNSICDQKESKTICPSDCQ